MRSTRGDAVALVFLSLLAVACATKVPAAAVAWDPSAKVLTTDASPSDDSTQVGYLRVDTDRDVQTQGSLSYDWVRRSYDVYDTAGTLIRGDVYNQGGRDGGEPLALGLPPGRYVVASVYGTTYRKVQVEIVSGATTDVRSEALREAPAVFR
jgi:hypothetical protein